jgi:hypothetical protein
MVINKKKTDRYCNQQKKLQYHTVDNQHTYNHLLTSTDIISKPN